MHRSRPRPPGSARLKRTLAGSRRNTSLNSHNTAGLSRANLSTPPTSPLGGLYSPAEVLQAAYRVLSSVVAVLSSQWPAPDLEDACQTAILRLWQYVASGKGHFSKDKDVAGWLLTSVPRRLISNYRQEKRRRKWEQEQGGTFVLERFPDPEAQLICREGLRFLEMLDPKDRALLLERGIAGDGEALSTEEHTQRQKLRGQYRATLLKREQ